MMAGFYLTRDVGTLFPYINAVSDGAELYGNPSFIKFRLDDCYCVLYPRYGLATPFNDRPEAVSFMESLISFLTGIQSEITTIEPNHKLFRRVSVLDILKLLPGTNCRKCGFPSCLSFAARLSMKEIGPDMCPFLGHPIAEQAVYPVYGRDGELNATVTIDMDFKKPVPDPNRPPNREMSEADSLPTPLTGREEEVLGLMAQGATNREIALHLRISPHTVKSHVIHIFNKLGVNDRTQAAVQATRQNLI
jgi:DNA-binding CsgD family transcriptional regulator/ArsR family metal-binding transcriptional regulator